MKFSLDTEQRDFAASIDAALAGADVPGAVRAWNKGDTEGATAVWARLSELGVTALAVAEESGGIGAHPVDLVVAVERLGRWCVPGPVVESLAVAPVLLAGDDRSAALAAGDEARFHTILAPTVPLSRHMFCAPTRFYKTGVVFMAWLNGHQDHFVMVGGQQSARSIRHFAELFRLADKAGLLRDPEMAVARMRRGPICWSSTGRGTRPLRKPGSFTVRLSFSRAAS
jgi:hypothetical protein